MKIDGLFAIVLVSLTAMMAGVSCTDSRGTGNGPADTLSAGFQAAPPSARPWVYWMVMDGNLTREGITADLEAMQRAGIGGVIFMEVNVHIPQGPVKFMSPEWRQLFKHAVEEAERLGLQITLNAGPGWTGSGGPWVKPEQSMQHLVATALDVTGPSKFDAPLPRPTPRPPYFGDNLPPEIRQAKNAFYRDVAVLAVPKTDAAQRIADIDEKALYLRHPYTSRPGTKPFLPAPASFPALSASAAIPADRVVDLTGRMGPDGRLAWGVPAGQWTILRFGRTSTGVNTRPAPQPGLGLECDKFDKAALEAHFDTFIGTLLREIGPRTRPAGAGWTMLHIDSWEMGAQNWTGVFRDEFRKRRGYDPLPFLPAMTGRVVESLEVSERFLWDLRQTAQELIIENHAQHLKELGRRHGFGLSIEPYDMTPCADMSLGAIADVPMCEFWLYGFNSTFSVIEAASIAHTCGRPVVAAEAFTSSAAERWLAYPASMKSLGDWAFCAGVNRIVFHRFQHQPWLDRWPGMTFGQYGVHWDRTQTWWDMAEGYHRYLARCQFMLQRGLPVADICYLVAEGAPHVFRPPPSATTGHPPDRLGYNFDGIAPETLAQATVNNGRLVLPDGMSYRVLVLPQRQTMTPSLLRKVKELVAAGATVIGPKPLKSPSLENYPKCDNDVMALAEELWTTRPVAGKGRVIGEKDLARYEPPALAGRHPLTVAKWIWHDEGKPLGSLPTGTRWFRRTVTLETTEGIESARVFMTADNDFELRVNGRRAGGGDDFHNVSELDVTAMLKPGENILSVTAANWTDTPNPAGLIGALAIKCRDGRVLEVPTDRQWQSAPAADGAWRSAAELGPMGMAPWRLGQTPSAPEPDQYCAFGVVANVLSGMGVALDFECDGPLRYTHRRDGDTDIYFVANRTDRPVEANCTFRVLSKPAELWDPVTGRRHPLASLVDKNGRTTATLRLDAAQSIFVVFRPRIGQRVTPSAGNFAELKTVQELNGPWAVSFDPKWGGPEKIVFDSLQDWSKRPEDGIRYYSGQATYRRSFDLKAKVHHESPIFLDLGMVRSMARVRLNGQDLGVVWCAPWRVDISGVVRDRDNQLEITVANLWPNRLIGDQALPPDKRLTWTTWNPFTKNSPLLESGLLGPVRLQTPNVAR